MTKSTDVTPRQNEMKSRIEQQIEQYSTVENMHSALSDINSYWKRAHHGRRFREATGCLNHVNFYVQAFKRAFQDTGFCRILSLGSGDGAVEVQVARELEKMNIGDYEFHLVELSPFQNDRAKKQVADLGFRGNFTTIEADLNEWVAECEYSSVMAHHSLHHILALEHVFDQIKSALHEKGNFATFDIIGRNGHLRWPETYAIINAFWHFLPDNKRRHAVLKWNSEDFRDHDCSTVGFEGIRAQDIMPELMKRFSFETFFAWGGLTDIFVGRGYGANFDPHEAQDCKFIDLVDELNEVLVDLGAIKPTNLCAVMQKTEASSPKFYKDRVPQNMVRIPD